MVLLEMVLLEMVLLEMVLIEMVLLEMVLLSSGLNSNKSLNYSCFHVLQYLKVCNFKVQTVCKLYAYPIHEISDGRYDSVSIRLAVLYVTLVCLGK